MFRNGQVWQPWNGALRLGASGKGKAWIGGAGVARRVMAGTGMDWSGRSGRHVVARLCKARHGALWQAR